MSLSWSMPVSQPDTPAPSAITREGLVMPVRVDPTGDTGPTRKQARGPYFRRTSRGRYVSSDVSNELVEQRIVEAAAVIPAGCALTGWAALEWLGGRWFGGLDAAGNKRPVPIAVGTRDIRTQAGIVVSAEGLNAAHILVVDGLPVTIPTYSVSYEMRYAPSDLAATTVLDMAAYSDLVSIAEQADRLANQNGWTGVPRARRAILRSSENAWSPREPPMRIAWEDAGLPTPLCNQPVFDLDGRHVGTPDLIDPVAGVVGEYDSELHLGTDAQHRDVVRDATYRRLGLEVVIMTKHDRTDPSAYDHRLREAYARAARRPAADRLWTVQPPPWWTPTITVDQRRALSQTERERLLRHRSA